MTATEVLRRLLDERGVEWGDIDTGGKRSLITLWHDAGGMEWQFYENTKTNWTLLKSRRDYLTPAQAIAATLGPCDCSNSERTGERTDLDAATLGRATCHIEEHHGDWYCTGCGEMVGTCDTASELCIDGNAIELWSYCPNCGRKVVDE